VCVDGVLVVSLYAAGRTVGRSRLFTLAVFIGTLALSGGFNVAYYRTCARQDTLAISVLLGFSAPVLAAAVAILKSLDDAAGVQRAQDERERVRVLELEKYTVEQSERTRRTVQVEVERTKQERARARATKAESTPSKRVSGAGRRIDMAGVQAALAADPDIGPRELARVLGCSPSGAAGALRRARTPEVIGGNGKGN